MERLLCRTLDLYGIIRYQELILYTWYFKEVIYLLLYKIWKIEL